VGEQTGPAFAPGAAADAATGKTIANPDVKLGIGRSGGQANNAMRQNGDCKAGKPRGPKVGEATRRPPAGEPHHAEPNIEIPAQ
jgi:hypothetical protein